MSASRRLATNALRSSATPVSRPRVKAPSPFMTISSSAPRSRNVASGSTRLYGLTTSMSGARRDYSSSPRSLSTTDLTTSDSTRRYTISDLSTSEYHRVSDETMDGLLDYLESVMDTESTAENGWEVDYNSGVMTLNFGAAHGTYVLNKQPPNKQIWLSSPISGPKRYDYDVEAKAWFYARDNVTLGELLTQEFQTIIAGEVNVPVA